MDFVQFIVAAFDYDRWANRQWLASLGGFKDMERAYQVLEHMLQAQQIWLTRCGAVIGPQQRDMPLQELFDIMTRAWKELMETASADELITYRNLKGEEFTQPLAEIALHVINHGTYHRGQLRGLAEAQGFLNFPETDLILFLRERSGQRADDEQSLSAN